MQFHRFHVILPLFCRLTCLLEPIFIELLLCCSNVVQVPLSLNPFQLNLEFGTTHRVALCVVHPRYTKSNRIYNKPQN